MEDKLVEMITGEQIVAWLIIAFLVGYFVYKEYPDFKKRVASGALEQQKNEETDRTMAQRLDTMENDIKLIKQKLDRDYGRLNGIEVWQKRYQKLAEDSLEEREIIMRGTLGCLKGLQQLGANGPTEKAEAEINDYLNRKAHDNDVEGRPGDEAEDN